MGKHIALDKIRRSELNRTLTDEDVRDLAASMRAVGQLVPIIVRPLEGESLYEIVAGERRWRAACLLEWRSIDAIVREDLDDKDAQELRLVENLQRRDVPPLMQADGVVALLAMHEGNHAEVAARLGVSESWVRRRARLASLIQEWREAIAAAKPGNEHYDIACHVSWQEEIARAPDNVQKALITHWGVRYAHRVETIREAVASFVREIATAPWAKSCAKCRKRSDKDDSLFPDYGDESGLAGGARCLDPECWDKKEDAHYEEERKREENQDENESDDNDDDNDHDHEEPQLPKLDQKKVKEVDALFDALNMHVRGLSSIPGDPMRFLMAIAGEMFGGEIAELSIQDRYKDAAAAPMRDIKQSLWPYLQRVLIGDLEFAQQNLNLDGLKAIEAFLSTGKPAKE